MTTAKELLNLLNEAAPGLLKSVVGQKAIKDQVKKQGLRMTKSSSGYVFTDPKTRKKIELKDTGKEVRAKNYVSGKAGKETKMRGSPDEISKALGSLSNKE